AEGTLLHLGAGRGGTERMAPLPANRVTPPRGYWRNIYPRPVSWMFYARSPEQPISTDSLRNAFNAARDRVGISRTYTFHCLRHSFAAHVHERGGSIDVIQDALGHRQSDTTRGYARATGRMFASLDHPLSGSAVLAA
ncbi:MAG: tyrosine-type recombinase/integrase, partial [Boseongicola sp.]|nr:tyrosine-type recombinase/integrase [Boseongicola sp.]